MKTCRNCSKHKKSICSLKNKAVSENDTCENWNWDKENKLITIIVTFVGLCVIAGIAVLVQAVALGVFK